jgi:hypothetical protein
MKRLLCCPVLGTEPSGFLAGRPETPKVVQEKPNETIRRNRRDRRERKAGFFSAVFAVSAVPSGS